MRIITGTAKGQRLFTPSRSPGVNHIRPTSDKVRESIFNIISFRLFEASVLDLFAGTGAMGIEALSRGCPGGVFVDKSPEAFRLITRNCDKCGFLDKANVLRHDLLKSPFFLKKVRPDNGFGLVFSDPPYLKGYSIKSLEIVNKFDLLAEDGLLVIEEAKEVDLPEVLSSLYLTDRRSYGDTAVSMYTKETRRKNS